MFILISLFDHFHLHVLYSFLLCTAPITVLRHRSNILNLDWFWLLRLVILLLRCLIGCFVVDAVGVEGFVGEVA